MKNIEENARGKNPTFQFFFSIIHIFSDFVFSWKKNPKCEIYNIDIISVKSIYVDILYNDSIYVFKKS